MKKFLFFIILFLFSLLLGKAQNSWSSKSDFGGVARYGAIAFSIGSKGYIGLGTGGGSYYYNDLWEYNPSTNTWIQKADFPGEGREYATAFVIGGKAYVGIGSKGQVNGLLKDFYEYNPSTNIWTQKVDFMGVAREGAVGFSIGTKGYVGLGEGYSADIRQDFYEYDPVSNSWSTKANFGGGARAYAVGFNICNKGYVGLGENSSGSTTQDFWEYNPTSNNWTSKANYPGGTTGYATGFSICTLGYVGTGTLYYGGNGKIDFWEYDPTTNAWITKADFPSNQRYSATGFSVAGKGYIGTGYGTTNPFGPAKDFFEYTPSNTFAPSQPGAITGPTVIYVGTNVSYSINSVNCATSYTWTVPSGCTIISGLGTTTITVSPGNNSGDITVVANNQCGSSSASTFGITIGVEEYGNSKNIDLKPNPSKGVFTIEILNQSITNAKIEIYNITGSMIYDNNLEIHKNLIDITNMPKGIYFVKVRDNNSIIAIKKIVVN